MHPEMSSKPGHKPARGDTRARIMEAAAAVVHDVGPAHLSLDAVAERAGISKGGLLYHFPTKASLIQAVVAHHCAQVELEAGIGPDGHVDRSPASVVSGLMRAFTVSMATKKPGGGAGGVLAALAETPELLEPVRVHNVRVADTLRKAKDPDVALLAFLAVEGLRALMLFDANPLTAAETEHILAMLDRMVRESEDVPARAKDASEA